MYTVFHLLVTRFTLINQLVALDPSQTTHNVLASSMSTETPLCLEVAPDSSAKKTWTIVVRPSRCFMYESTRGVHENTQVLKLSLSASPSLVEISTSDAVNLATHLSIHTSTPISVEMTSFQVKLRHNQDIVETHTVTPPYTAIGLSIVHTHSHTPT